MMTNLVLIKYFGDKWIGTPFKQNGNSHRGIDCKNLINNLIQDIAEIKIDKSIPIIPHGKEIDAIELFKEFYPSDHIKEYINGAIIFHNIGRHYAMSMVIDRKTMISVDQSIGVCYKQIQSMKDVEKAILYPKAFQTVTIAKAPGIATFINTCKGCS